MPRDLAGTTLPAADGTAESGQPLPSGASKESIDQPGASSVSENQQEPVREKDWLGDAMRALRSSQFSQPTSKGAPPVSQDSPEAKAEGDPTPESVRTSAEAAKPDAPASQDTPADTSIQLTQDELNRRVQSEVDRRLSKFQEEQSIRRKEQEKKELRRKDPYAYVELEEEEEEQRALLEKQMNEARTLAVNSLRAYDTAVLDPLFNLLPATEKQEILDTIEDGISGRGKAASQALKVLERQWKQAGISDARRALLNDQAFVKEVFAKYGNGGRIEPTSMPASGAPAPGSGQFNMNDWIREAAGRRAR